MIKKKICVNRSIVCLCLIRVYLQSMNEQLFHTKAKPYVALHPMSFFGNHPQVLQLEEPDIVAIPGFRSKGPVSPKHQLLTYL